MSPITALIVALAFLGVMMVIALQPEDKVAAAIKYFMRKPTMSVLARTEMEPLAVLLDRTDAAVRDVAVQRRPLVDISYVDPLIQGLLTHLPAPGDVWPEAERQLWLDLAKGGFKMIYRTEEAKPS